MAVGVMISGALRPLVLLPGRHVLPVTLPGAVPGRGAEGGSRMTEAGDLWEFSLARDVDTWTGSYGRCGVEASRAENTSPAQDAGQAPGRNLV